MISDQSLLTVLRSRRTVRLWGDVIRVAVAIGVLVALAYVLIYYRFLSNTLNDFRVFYYSTQAFLAGGDMYGPTPATAVPVGGGRFHDLWNMNPPHFHLILVPFTLLPLGPAKFWWMALNGGLLLWSLHAIVKTLGRAWTMAGILWTVFAVLVFSATGGVLATGQVAWLVMLPVTLAWIKARRGHWIHAAVLLGAAASVKPFLGVFLIYFLVKRRWREAATMISAVAASVGVGLLIFGPGSYLRWFETLRSVDWAWAPMNCSVTGYLTRIFSENPFVEPVVIAPGIVAPVALSVSLVLAIVTFRRLPELAGSDQTDRIFALLILVSLLVSPLGWIYYLWLAAGPLLACFWFRRRPLATGQPALLFLAAPGLMWPPHLFVLWRHAAWAAPTFAGIYFWSTLLLWIAALRGSADDV